MTAAPSAAKPTPAFPLWPLWKRLIFRFVAIYGVLYVTAGLFLPWRSLTQWAALNLLGRSLPVQSVQNGSGDTLENYVLVGLYLVLAAGRGRHGLRVPAQPQF